jgi:ATP-dependent RNA helicase RhlB
MVKKLIQKVIKHLRSRANPTKAPAAPKAELRVPTPPAKAPSTSAEAQEFHPRRHGQGQTQGSSHSHGPGPSAGHGASHGHSHGSQGGRHGQGPRPPRPPRPPSQPAPNAEETDRLRHEKAKAAHVSWDPASFQVPACEGKMRFNELALAPEIMHAVADLGFQYCTPIQAGIMPQTLQGRDAFGQAQTGTGKTAAFLITILQHLLTKPPLGPRKPGTPRALVLAPTRELCMQIYKDAVGLSTYTGTNTVAVFGGMDYEKQKNQLRGQLVDIVAATPGRLLDFKKRGDLDLRQVEVLVLDEADRMLDMGFIPDVRTIVHSTPTKDRRQTLFFSATLNDDVRRLATQWTRDPASVTVAPEAVAVDTVEQVVYIVTLQEKFALLYNILQRENAQRVIVFVNRRDSAEDLLYKLRRYNINSALLSGAVPQEKRVRVLEQFRAGEIRVLVATDVAGRGIHVDSVSHVVNYNMPFDAEDYVHRIGRTGRAGASGTSISFACEEDSFYIPDIEKFIGRPLSCTHPEDEWLKLPPPPPGAPEAPDRPRERRPGGRGGGGSFRRGGPRPGGRGRRPPPRR